MNRILLSAAAICAAISADAALVANRCSDITPLINGIESAERPVQPSYLNDAVTTGGWKSNWFVGISGGASNFLGSPLGCDDMFGRLKPTFRANVGKWFTPSVGSRIAFEGFDIKASDLTTKGYRAYHMDMMWNVASMILKTGYDSQWDIIPFFGAGCAYSSRLGDTPFAISYGVIGQYRLTDRLRLTAELSNITTSKCFDGHSMSKGLGDNILGLTAGLSFTFGEKGWKRVIDAGPYIAQNEMLLARNYSLKESNRHLGRVRSHDIRVIEELKKIIRIEGLLGKYGKAIADLDTAGYNDGRSFPKNDYSGLNSLLARIRDYKNGRKGMDAYGIGNHDGTDAYNNACNNDDAVKGLFGLTDDELIAMLGNDRDDDGLLNTDGIIHDEEDGGIVNPYADNKSSGDIDNSDGSADGSVDGSGKSWSEYVKAISSGRQCIGAPVFFFFRIGTTSLTDESQLVNIREIARLAVNYGLKVKVVGAADSATGTDEINNRLSADRAKRIADELAGCGVPQSSISHKGSGGINAYEPCEANRHTRIELYR